MDLKWDDPRTRKFVTNAGLITTNGPFGSDVMAAEWTHHVSYAPSLMVVCVYSHHVTHPNIMKSREFGINLCSASQSIVSSIAGGSSGKDVDKIAVLKGMGVEFYKGKKINALMVKNAAMNAECKLHKAIELGDHTMFVGKVVEISASDELPLIYSNGKYWNFGSGIEKPAQKILDKINALVEKDRKR
ncbi:MAG TPA: flavin reductase family protein [Candidatus Nanoarchaeia archaeon]|nr:flavin reductase family protein [Candidatus Nanoarchaeia archaeon]